MAPEDIPAAMELLGADAMIAISHLMLAYPNMRADDTRGAALARGIMRYLLDQIVDPDAGIYTLLLVPYQDPEASVEIIEEFKDERGIVGVCFVTEGAEPPFGHRQYDPIYDATQDANLPIVFHAGGSGLDDYHIKGYEKFIETHTLGFLESNMATLTSLVVQGVPEKFPDLDMVFQESGVLYVSSLMHRLDAEYLKRRSEAPLLTKRPSKYMREFYYGTQPLEHPDDLGYFEKALEVMGGPAAMMYASDYPHWDFDMPTVVNEIPFYSQVDKKQILSGNAQEVFDL
jgi:predicted TIM-barrel fold metal-dependent hydrolase